MINNRLSIHDYSPSYDLYKKDESRLAGSFDSISFPESIEEIIAIYNTLSAHGTPVTVQGNRTGICGGSVPLRGHVMSLEKLNQIHIVECLNDYCLINVLGGTTLEALDLFLLKKGFFWPPDPTEKQSTIGGIIATGAKGMTHSFYGESKKYVQSVTYLHPSGIVKIVTKDDEDFHDLFSSEGMLGIILSAELIAIQIPKESLGIGFFFNSWQEACDFGEDVVLSFNLKEVGIVALEFLDRQTLTIIQNMKATASHLKEIPSFPDDVHALMYIEIHGSDEDALMDIAEELLLLSEKWGSDIDSSWALSGHKEISVMHTLRHSAPESVNHYLSTLNNNHAITKLATDFSLRSSQIKEWLNYCYDKSKDFNIPICVFGHFLDAHLHINLLPDNLQKYKDSITLLDQWYAYAAKLGANLFAEHGIGKLKRSFYQQYSDHEDLKSFISKKHIYDKHGLFNPGNRFD